MQNFFTGNGFWRSIKNAYFAAFPRKIKIKNTKIEKTA